MNSRPVSPVGSMFVHVASSLNFLLLPSPFEHVLIRTKTVILASEENTWFLKIVLVF